MPKRAGNAYARGLVGRHRCSAPVGRKLGAPQRRRLRHRFIWVRQAARTVGANARHRLICSSAAQRRGGPAWRECVQRLHGPVPARARIFQANRRVRDGMYDRQLPRPTRNTCLPMPCRFRAWGGACWQPSRGFPSFNTSVAKVASNCDSPLGSETTLAPNPSVAWSGSTVVLVKTLTRGQSGYPPTFNAVEPCILLVLPLILQVVASRVKAALLQGQGSELLGERVCARVQLHAPLPRAPWPLPRSETLAHRPSTVGRP